jgi:hypothetical protein
MLCKNDNIRTHSQVVLQPGATMGATAKPEKKNKDTSDGVKSDILSGFHCPVALRVVGLEGTGDGAQNNRLIDWTRLKEEIPHISIANFRAIVIQNVDRAVQAGSRVSLFQALSSSLSIAPLRRLKQIANYAQHTRVCVWRTPCVQSTRLSHKS